MKTLLTINDIEAGKSYACYFLIRQGLASSEHFGVIKTRDTNKELVEIIEIDTGTVYVVKWSDCWSIDEVDWYDPNQIP